MNNEILKELRKIEKNTRPRINLSDILIPVKSEHVDKKVFSENKLQNCLDTVDLYWNQEKRNSGKTIKQGLVIFICLLSMSIILIFKIYI